MYQAAISDFKNGLEYQSHSPSLNCKKTKTKSAVNAHSTGQSGAFPLLETFDQYVYEFVYEQPGLTVWDIQQEIDQRKKKKITESLRFLARHGLVTNINNRIYPVCRSV